MSMLDQLLEMGFDGAEAEGALRATNETGLEAAMNYILDHPQPQPDDITEIVEKAESQAKPNTERNEDRDNKQSTSIVEVIEDDDEKSHQAKVEDHGQPQPSSAPEKQPVSYKCLECGKLFPDMGKLSVHVGITKHANFEQSTEVVKPLTEAENQEKLARAQVKLTETRARREEQAKRDAIEQELKRRQDGQSIAEIEEQRKQKEMKDWIALKKREKIEDQEARNRVLEQIKMDREARRNVDHPETPTVQSRPPCQPTAVTQPAPSTSCTDTKLQIRLSDGGIIRETFKAKEMLGAVRVWAQVKSMEKGLVSGNIELISPFPRRVFTENDYATPLSALGLTPSACLVVQPLPTEKTE